MVNLWESNPFNTQAVTEEVFGLQEELFDFLSENKKKLSFDELWDEYLERIIKILQRIESLVPLEEWINPDYALRVLETASTSSIIEESILSVDSLLAKYLEAIEEKLSVESIKLKFTIYPPKEPTVIEEWDGSFNIEETTSVPKFQAFLTVLEQNNVSFEDLIVLEEDEEVLKKDKRMRKFPYKIVYLTINDIQKTVLISDEIGQATFVYEWVIVDHYFTEFSKWESIQWIEPEKIVYWKFYSERLQKSIFEEKQQLSTDRKIYLEIDQKEVAGEAKEGTKNKIMWRNQILEIRDQLERDSNILCMDDVWYFWDAKWHTTWPQIWWKNISSFPSCTFNKEKWIWKSNGMISTISDLSKMFQYLWLQVATNEEEKIRWKNLLLDVKEWLSQTWIYCIPTERSEEGEKETVDVWYFWDAKWAKFWPLVQWRKLQSFPNAFFFRANNIGDKNSKISHSAHLRQLFEVLWLQVASPDEEKQRWASMIVDIKDELEDANLYCIDNIWYFWDANGMEWLPLVSWRRIMNFPNATFNKENEIWDERWKLRNHAHLRQLFEVLWLQVASPDEENQRWASMIVDIKDELEKESNILCIDDLWYFWDAIGMPQSANIRWKNLKSFPNTRFNTDNNIWDKAGRIISINDLKDLFKVLWLEIADENNQRDLWRWVLESEKELLSEVGIYCMSTERWERDKKKLVDIWYFLYTKQHSVWPHIWWKNLASFPNATFNKEKWIGSKGWILTSKNHLKELFKSLWLEIATEEEEKEYGNKVISKDISEWRWILESEKELLSEAWIYCIPTERWEGGDREEVDVWYFWDAKGKNHWPVIRWKKLYSFPNIVFNRNNNISIARKWEMTSPKHLRQMFTLLWLQVATPEEEDKRK